MRLPFRECSRTILRNACRRKRRSKATTSLLKASDLPTSCPSLLRRPLTDRHTRSLSFRRLGHVGSFLLSTLPRISLLSPSVTSCTRSCPPPPTFKFRRPLATLHALPFRLSAARAPSFLLSNGPPITLESDRAEDLVPEVAKETGQDRPLIFPARFFSFFPPLPTLVFCLVCIPIRSPSLILNPPRFQGFRAAWHAVSDIGRSVFFLFSPRGTGFATRPTKRLARTQVPLSPLRIEEGQVRQGFDCPALCARARRNMKRAHAPPLPLSSETF